MIFSLSYFYYPFLTFPFQNFPIFLFLFKSSFPFLLSKLSIISDFNFCLIVYFSFSLFLHFFFSFIFYILPLPLSLLRKPFSCFMLFQFLSHFFLYPQGFLWISHLLFSLFLHLPLSCFSLCLYSTTLFNLIWCFCFSIKCCLIVNILLLLISPFSLTHSFS